MTMTHHAHMRAQQRCIPPLVIDWLLAYGKREPSHGAERICFDKHARRELAQDVGEPVVKLLGRYLNTSIIFDPPTGSIITVMWRH